MPFFQRAAVRLLSLHGRVRDGGAKGGICSVRVGLLRSRPGGVPRISAILSPEYSPQMGQDVGSTIAIHLPARQEVVS